MPDIFVVAIAGFDVERALRVAVEVGSIFHRDPRVRLVGGEKVTDVVALEAVVDVHAGDNIWNPAVKLVLNTDDSISPRNNPNSARYCESGRAVVTRAPGDFRDGGLHPDNLKGGAS